MEQQCRDRPNTLPWPPLIFAFTVLLALALGWLVPLGSLLGPVPVWLRVCGAAFLASGIGLVVWAIVTIRRADTNVMPHKAADRLVSHGPFALSRNPIYLGNFMLLTGIALALDSPWFLAAAIADALLVQELAIKREEAHLALRFGEAWAAYAAKVPRWLGPI